MTTYRVLVRETYEIEYEIEASSGVEARRILRDENPTFLGSVDGDPDGRPMHYDCIKRTVFSPGAGNHRDRRVMTDWTCETCGKPAEAHSLALAIEHIHGGSPTRSGRNFNREEAQEVADRILDRLAESVAPPAGG